MTLRQDLGSSLPGDCDVAYGVYDMLTRRVQVGGVPGLSPAPGSLGELETLAAEWGSS